MCDAKTEAQADTLISSGAYTRRHFGGLAGAIGLAVAFSGCTGEADINSQGTTPKAGSTNLAKSDVIIDTPDGDCDAYFVHPASGKHPGVIIWPDIRGLRPAFKIMADRLANEGYAVLVVHPFYRSVSAQAMIEKIASLPTDQVRPFIFGNARATNAQTNRIDATAYIGWLDSQMAVDTSRRIGVTGYCYGGPVTMRVAAMFPERIGAGGSFHGGGLATDQADSPHLGVPKMQADFLIAIAQNDDEKEPDAKILLRNAFDAAPKSTAEIEVYPAQHGWCPPDSRVYDAIQANRAHDRLVAIFGKALS